MTTNKKTTNLPSETASSLESVPKEFKGVGTLRHRLLISVLPAVLLPLVIASGIGYGITESRAKNQVIQKLETETLLASKTVGTFIRDSLKLTNIVAANPMIIEAMTAGTKQAQENQLIKQPINTLEKKFAATKLLRTDDSLNNYLQQIVKSGQVAEIFFTERNGLNVAFSNPTSDFVQRDEGWWQNSQAAGQDIGEPEFDESANAIVIAFSQAVKDPKTQEFLGVIKAAVPATTSIADLTTYLNGEQNQASQFQIIDPNNSFVFSNIDFTDTKAPNRPEINTEGMEVLGGEPILQVGQTMNQVVKKALNEAQAQRSISQIPGLSDIKLRPETKDNQTSVIATFRYQNKIYSLSSVANTDLISIGVIDYGVVASAGRSLLVVFAVTGLVLGTFSLGLITLLGQQLSRPLTKLSEVTQQAASGNLNVIANLEGTQETRSLADNFNQLISRVKNLIQEQQNLNEQQRQEKDKLEGAIYALLDEVSDASDGDLTVRANLDSMELSTVADLFNAIITNLQDIAIEVRQSSSQVGSYLKQNEEVILVLAEQALSEAEETRETLSSVEQMSQSIKAVAANASQAEKIADDTYNTVIDSSSNMDLTVDSILALRNTVGETSKKMKRLGESSQKISQVVSFIEEIAIKTNVLAINASVEAGRAGEYGEGFTIVAEQVGALAEQSATATREIAKIVAAIQAETLEVNQAMEFGTTQVVETTRIVESTKQSLGLVLEKSQEINQLMESISQTTVSQADTSQNVTKLMQKISLMSETTSKSSQQVAQSIVVTAEVASKLESTVAQFKVAESA